MPLDDRFIERLKLIVPETKLDAVMHTFARPQYLSARVNTLKANVENIFTEIKEAGITAEKVSWYQDAFVIPQEQKEALMKTRAYQNGEIYIQDLSSMIAPIALDPKPSDEILDLTSAPGSKTSQIAALMKNQGRIAAVEKSRKRFFKLKQNLRDLDVTCAELYNKDGRMIWKTCKERFDRVLLDAPCSSEARFSIDDPESTNYWSEKKIKEMARNQWALLCSAMQCLKPGGVLVYSTCSFAPEENENNIARLLKKYKDAITIEPIHIDLNNQQPGLTQWQGKSFPEPIKNAVRIIPTEKMSGFFICKVRLNNLDL